MRNVSNLDTAMAARHFSTHLETAMHYSYMVIDFADLGGDFAAGLDFIRDCGYEGVELNLDPRGTQSIRCDRTRGGGVRLSGAVAFDRSCLCRGTVLERGRLAHRRAGAVARLREYLPIAQRFNAILVVGLLQGLCADEA